MSQEFEIKAGTFVFKNGGDNSILDGTTTYTIPVYQRPYSWHKEQVVRLIRDIFESFRGVEGDKKSEPMFIGTMQLKPEDGKTYIIDGQQRLTTSLILFKVLLLRYPKNEELQNIDLSWIETQVSAEEQQNKLNDLKKLCKGELDKLTEEANIDRKKEAKNINHYIQNAIVINQELDKQIIIDDESEADSNSEESKAKKLDIDKFIGYFFTKIHFVVIETKAGISKTLKIFDAINTTGLDLNTGDIFKIRMYEYLKNNLASESTQNENKIFESINELYEEVEKFNKEEEKKITSIQEILRIYQFYLIGKYDLPVVLYSFATDTFYERLFETLFKINTNWPNFKKIAKKEIDEFKLDLDEIKGLIDARIERYKTWDNMNVENKMYRYLWSWSRYGNRKMLMDIYLYKNTKNNNGFEGFVKDIVITFLQYSLYYDRSIYKINRGFTHETIKSLLNINSNTNFKKTLIEEDQKGLQKRLKGNIFHLTTAKNILCRISASLEILKKNDEIDYIFTGEMDIEHIQSHTDENEKTVPEGWEAYINTLGNLVLLERSINRSVSNKSDKKIENEKGYPSSKLTIVNLRVLSLVTEGEKWVWDTTKSKIRKENEVEKIWKFLCLDNKILKEAKQ
jgi:uncharacterized protein with ParB-like and HNH nuclease domain